MTTNPSPMAKTEQEGHLREEYEKAERLWKAATVDRDAAKDDAKRGWDEVHGLMKELGGAQRKLQAAEAELVHTREAAELLRDPRLMFTTDAGPSIDALRRWRWRDAERAMVTTEEQAAPAAVELPGGKGPDYVTRAGLAAALRKLAMCRDADTAPRHIAWQNLANELEAKGE